MIDLTELKRLNAGRTNHSKWFCSCNKDAYDFSQDIYTVGPWEDRENWNTDAGYPH